MDHKKGGDVSRSLPRNGERKFAITDTVKFFR